MNREPTRAGRHAAASPLDFAVIGASKSGTTSLYRHLRAHPRLFLPEDKDVPYFSADDWYERGWKWVSDQFFQDAPPEALWGTVTPRYMEDLRVPARMAAEMPDLKLIALLRNPVDRAFSQYRQQVRQGKDKRSFSEAVATHLSRRAPKPGGGKRLPTEDRYLSDGEYDRILSGFDACFPPNQLLILFTEELAEDAGRVMDSIAAFLGLPPGFRPHNLDRRYHRGGSRERFPGLVSAARRVAPIRALWHLIPLPRRKAIQMWFFTQINVVSEAARELPGDLRARLVEYFEPDVRRLEKRIERPVPWRDFS